MSSKLCGKIEEVNSFELAGLGKNEDEAVFLKTADDCYLITHFKPFLAKEESVKVIIKDINQNKSGMGKKAPFGKIMEFYSKNPRVGEKFVYKTADKVLATGVINQIMVGEFEDVEEHFLETIREMLGTKSVCA